MVKNRFGSLLNFGKKQLKITLENESEIEMTKLLIKYLKNNSSNLSIDELIKESCSLE